jgi:hypothetical protein
LAPSSERATTSPSETPTTVSIVERYLHHVVGHDWNGVTACLTKDVVRTGPFGDVYSPRESYVAYLADLMPTLRGYAMRIDRVLELGRVAVAELTETVEVDGAPVETPEALVFDLAPEGRISRIAIYIQRGPPR